MKKRGYIQIIQLNLVTKSTAIGKYTNMIFIVITATTTMCSGDTTIRSVIDS